MAQIDLLKRYLDAGMTFTQLTEKKAKAIVKDLVKAGEVQTGEASRRVEELLDRSRKNSEGLRELVAGEVRNQVSKLGLVPKKELDAVKRELAALKAKQGTTATAPKPAAKKATPVKKTVKKAAAKKAVAKPAAIETPATVGEAPAGPPTRPASDS